MNSTLWTDSEISLLGTDLTDSEIAKKTGRTLSAVHTRRCKYRKENDIKITHKNKVIDMQIAARIKTLRQKAGLTRYELGEKLGYGSRKSAGNNVCQFENATRVPTDEKLNKLAEVFEVTVDYILTGKEDTKEVKEEKVEEEPKKEVVTKPDPQPVKTAMLNNEGYVDPTAAKAMAIVMNDKPTRSFSIGNKVLPKHDPKPGEVYEVLNCNTPLLVIGKVGDNVLMTNLFTRINHNDIYTVKLNLGGTYYGIDFSKMFTRKIIDLIDKVGEIDISVMDKIKKRYAAGFGLGLSKPKEETKPQYEKPDAATLRFIDSVQYFNEKNKTEFIVPGGCLTLQKAIDISEKMEISLTELLKDHTQDRVLDEICVLEERLKTLKESIGLND